MVGDVKKKMAEKSETSLQHLKGELAGIRTGRASLALFDSVQVNYYGTATPLKQIATLSIPDSRTIIIQPWDTSQLPELEKAILGSGLGLTPSNDGKIIRISIPPLTEERRKDLVKLVKKVGEESKVAIRNIRRDTNDELKSLQKDGTLSEDALRKAQDEVQKLTDQTIAKVDEILKKKEAEIMEV
ncbi:MAG: ribosome recycling factor [Nitrospirae bacterium]|nr:ribosome recycling factor [Candidatus Manganitrophaceae bacterium]